MTKYTKYYLYTMIIIKFACKCNTLDVTTFMGQR